MQCSGGFVTSVATLQPFVGAGCQVLTSPLTLSALPSIDPSVLLAAFANVSAISGGLSVNSNSFLVTLDCFQSLKTPGIVYVVNNDALVDARLPLLANTTNIVVSGNRHLCPLNFPNGTGECSVIDVQASLFMTGVTAAQFTPAQAFDLWKALNTSVTAAISEVGPSSAHAIRVIRSQFSAVVSSSNATGIVVSFNATTDVFAGLALMQVWRAFDRGSCSLLIANRTFLWLFPALRQRSVVCLTSSMDRSPSPRHQCSLFHLVRLTAIMPVLDTNCFDPAQTATTAVCCHPSVLVPAP